MGTGMGLAWQEAPGHVFGRVWNRTELCFQSKPGLLAGYPDPLLTLPLSKKIKRNRKQPHLRSTSGAAIRRHFTCARMEVDIPSDNDDYNHFKGGVNIADQYREAYFTEQTSHRNWLPLFDWLLDIAIINGFVLACSKLSTTTTRSGRKKRPITHKNFRLETAVRLVEQIQQGIRQKQQQGCTRTAKHSRQKDHLCYFKTFAVTEVPTTCTHNSSIVKAGKQKECVDCRFSARQQGLKSVLANGKRKRATYGSFACTLCSLSFCKKCAAKYKY